MFNTKIVLVISSLDLSDGNKYVLSKDKDVLDLPNFNLDSDIDFEINNILYKHTNFNNSWANIKIKKAFVEDKTLIIYYLTKIPFNSIIDGHWVKDSVACLIDKNIQECLLYV
jgi:hypothetical protein